MKRRTISPGPAERGTSLSSLIERELGLATGVGRELVLKGAAYLDGRRCLEPGRALRPGQRITVVLEESGKSPLASTPPPPPLVLLYEDAQLLAVDKPAGLPAQPTAGRVGLSLLDLVSAHLGREAGLVHRLDRETSGVTVFAKTEAAAGQLAAQFREGDARKRYLAVSGPGLPERARVELPISRDPSRPGRYRAGEQWQGKSALTELERLFQGEEYCLVALYPRTGRTHQLRAHLRALGAPILGDSLYGGKSSAAGLQAPRVLLHAQALRLRHPASGAELAIEAPLPKDMEPFFRAAGLGVLWGH